MSYTQNARHYGQFPNAAALPGAPIETGATAYVLDSVGLSGGATSVPAHVRWTGSAWQIIALDSFWALAGNANTNPAIHYVGTQDGRPLRLGTNGTERLRIQQTTGRLITSQTFGAATDNVVITGGNDTMTGNENTVIGRLAGDSLTTGERNTLVGFEAGRNISTVNETTAIGNKAASLSSATRSAHFGCRAGANSSGFGLVNIGYLAGLSASGDRSVNIGYDSGFMASGQDSVNIGYAASGSSQYGVFVGRQAATNAAVGSSNVGIGDRALTNCTSGQNNVCVGAASGTGIATGSRNVAVRRALGTDSYLRPNAERNVLIGIDSGVNADIHSAAVGDRAAAFLVGTQYAVFGAEAAEFHGRSPEGLIAGYRAGRNGLLGTKHVILGGRAQENAPVLATETRSFTVTASNQITLSVATAFPVGAYVRLSSSLPVKNSSSVWEVTSPTVLTTLAHTPNLTIGVTGTATIEHLQNYDNIVALGNGAQCTASNQTRIGDAAMAEVRTAGTYYGAGFVIVSHEELKENVRRVDAGKALKAIRKLVPVAYRRKQDAKALAEENERLVRSMKNEIEEIDAQLADMPNRGATNMQVALELLAKERCARKILDGDSNFSPEEEVYAAGMRALEENDPRRIVEEALPRFESLHRECQQMIDGDPEHPAIGHLHIRRQALQNRIDELMAPVTPETVRENEIGLIYEDAAEAVSGDFASILENVQHDRSGINVTSLLVTLLAAVQELDRRTSKTA